MHTDYFPFTIKPKIILCKIIVVETPTPYNFLPKYQRAKNSMPIFEEFLANFNACTKK
jgi:hypothetical protein